MKLPPGEQWSATPVRDAARGMRRTASQAERLLWSRLRNHGLEVKFRRQHPIGPYIVDFFSHEARLVVEIEPRSDGHNGEPRADLERAGYLEQRGLRLLRLSSDEVITGFDSALERISEFLRSS
jgi:very-short-patch-repair endonuclease